MEYINTLKDFIQHLKHEINEKDMEIQRKNDLLNIVYINSMNASKENIEVETRLHSTMANETQISDTLHEIRNNDEQLLRDDDNRLINDNSYYTIRENDDVFPIENNSIWITDNREHRKKYNGINNDGKDEIIKK